VGKLMTRSESVIMVVVKEGGRVDIIGFHGDMHIGLLH
jgi:hypothetical protein